MPPRLRNWPRRSRGPEIIENEAHRSLLLLFNGTKTVDEPLAAEKKAPTDAATIAYGGECGTHNGDEPEAVARFDCCSRRNCRHLVSSHLKWNSPGARLGPNTRSPA